MHRFVSHLTTRLDAKGRLSIPAPFRGVLARDGFDGLYVHPSLDWPTLDCGGHALLAAVDAALAPLSGQPEQQDTLALVLLGEADILKMDGEGRVSLPEQLKAHAGIATQVTLVGAGYKFQIWEPDRFRARLGEARAWARARRSGLPGGEGAASMPAPEARE